MTDAKPLYLDADGDTMVANTLDRLSPTVSTFAERIKRKLKEQEEIEGASQRQTRDRQQLMLQALTVIRRGFQETARIELGNRFYLKTVVGEYDGWPKIALNLVDRQADDAVARALIVTANDSSSKGLLNFYSDQGEAMLRLSMADPHAFSNIPFEIKKILRLYLDIIGAHVLNPPRLEDMLSVQTRSIESSALHSDSSHMSSAQLFSEDMSGNRNAVEVSADEAELAPLKLD